MFIVITARFIKNSVGAKCHRDRWSIKRHIALLKELPSLDESRFYKHWAPNGALVVRQFDVRQA
jgi:hypothetical protein